MFNKLAPSWKEVLHDELKKTYLQELDNFLAEEEKNGVLIFPKKENIFKALDLTSFKDVKVVILGQDPYHGEGQAHGLSFSVNKGMKIPPSLRNIFKELQSEYTDFTMPTSGDLSSWAKQGVLLLNTCLTVRANKAASHQGKGWEILTNNIISLLSEQHENLIFILWGAFARQKTKLIDHNKHYIIESAHPSPLSAYQGFWGSNPFSKSNHFLVSKGLKPINWLSICNNAQQKLF